MNDLVYLVRNATLPVEHAGAVVTAHVCNDAGGWGRGFSGQLSKRYPEAERAYRRKHRESGVALGATLLVPAERRQGLFVANMIAQAGYGPSRQPRIRLDALTECLACIRARMSSIPGYVVQMPRIGSGYGGGDWCAIAGVVRGVFAPAGIQVYVCDLTPLPMTTYA
jgi:O-acetyl-ADP-ribose deacetylase (regulator of RNase III)